MKRILIIALCALFALGASAQKPQQQRQRQEFSPELFRQKLEEFVTKEACLTTDEQKKVFPLIHEMMEKQRRNGDMARDIMQSCGENASEAQYQLAVTKSVEFDIKNKQIEKDFYQKLHKVVSWKKVYQVKRALIRFQMEALRHFSPKQHPKDGPKK